jgi:PAS domain S-box-containing protein
MYLFLLGYLGSIIILLFELSEIIPLLTGFVFLFGALFVLITVQVEKKTIVALLNTSVSKTYVENIIKSMADSLIVINLDNELTIQTVNKAATLLLRYNENEIIGKPISHIAHSSLMNQIKIDTIDALDLLKDIETEYYTKNGEPIPVSFSASVLKNNDGEIEGVIFVAKDIRERKEAERKIKKYIKQLTESELKLKELNASKDKFFSIIAHDLRNPFAAVLGYSEILANDSKDLSVQELEEFSTNLHKQAKLIFDLLENLLTWSRIQTGRMKYNPKEISLYDKVSEVYDIFESVANNKTINLKQNVDKDIIVYADSEMVYTVLRNLISNAIKFTPKGGDILINVDKREDNFILVTVLDTGVGMNLIDQQKLFKMDVHHSQKGTENEDGTGLGLLLCKELVNKNGGDIWVESELGQGSKFIFTLPAKQTWRL